MRCKKGDLAIVLTAPPGSVVPRDAIVVCLELLPVSYRAQDGSRTMINDVWLIEWRGMREHGGVRLGRPDCELRPIRPGDGEDETLAWAGKPEEATA